MVKVAVGDDNGFYGAQIQLHDLGVDQGSLFGQASVKENGMRLLAHSGADQHGEAVFGQGEWQPFSFFGLDPLQYRLDLFMVYSGQQFHHIIL